MAHGPERDARYKAVLTKVLDVCGDLCSYEHTHPSGGGEHGKGWWENPHVDTENLQKHMVRRPISCPRFFTKEAESAFDASPFEWPPPSDPPAPMKDHYLLGGLTYHEGMYLYIRYAGSEVAEAKWDVPKIEDLLARAERGDFEFGTYGAGEAKVMNDLFAGLHTDSLTAGASARNLSLKGAHVLVVGSERPWLEVLLLRAGARHVTTLEYGNINCTHPQITALTPHEFNKRYREGTLPVFDAAASYSSLEHSGLGRYGDGLNPWGDIITSAKLSCVVKQGGPLILGLPTNEHADGVAFNAHRYYGPKRWALMLTNWLATRVLPNHGHWVVVATNERADQKTK